MTEQDPWGGRPDLHLGAGHATGELADWSHGEDARGAVAEPDNPMLAALLHDARNNVDALGIDVALLQLATHCWFEGGIEGYDRGQSDARGIEGSADGR